MSAARQGVLALALLALLPAPPPARALPLAGARIDFVRVDGRGRHQAVVSVFDADGQPVSGLEQAFHAQLDGQDVGTVTAQALRAHSPRANVTLVIDASLLRGDGLAGVQDAVKALAQSLSPGDRIRVVAAGREPRSREGGAGNGEALAAALAGLADDATPLLYDALFDAARAQSRRGERDAGTIVLITRGADGGSRRTSIEVLALARTQSRLTPVMVVTVGDEGAAAEGDRLQRLADHTGGATAHTASPAELAGGVPGFVTRALGGWVLGFDTPAGGARADRHMLEVVVDAQGERRQASLEYASGDVTPAAWWRSPWVWMLPVLVLAAIVALGLFSRPRQQFLLVHDGGEEDGTWYEFFALPARVGGAEGNDVVFSDPQVSRNHAVFERRGRSIELVDLNSENGTLVNGERVSRRSLADGDRISFGPDIHLVYEARS